MSREFTQQYGVEPEVLFNPSMPSSALGQLIGDRALLDVYIDFLKDNLQPTALIASEARITGSEIQQEVAASQSLDMSALLIRTIATERVPVALVTGTDRDHTSELTAASLEWEQTAMRNNGLSPKDTAEVFYATSLDGDALYGPNNRWSYLVYYSPASKLIKPSVALSRGHTNNFRMFLSPELKQPSLVGVLTDGQNNI